MIVEHLNEIDDMDLADWWIKLRGIEEAVGMGWKEFNHGCCIPESRNGKQKIPREDLQSKAIMRFK